MSIALVIHGGAGVIPRGRLSAEGEARRRAVLRDALAAGEALLEGGAPALDAVVAAVRVLEEAPEFNAGRGGVLNTEGMVQHDASIMCAATRQAGGVAGVTGVRSPILAARAVMERSAHVLLVGQGALSFARDQGLELMDPAWFVTPGRARQLERVRAGASGCERVLAGASGWHLLELGEVLDAAIMRALGVDQHFVVQSWTQSEPVAAAKVLTNRTAIRTAIREAAVYDTAIWPLKSFADEEDAALVASGLAGLDASLTLHSLGVMNIVDELRSAGVPPASPPGDPANGQGGGVR